MANPKNLRSGIGDLVNDLVKVANNTTNADQQTQLHKLINVYFILWQQVILDQLNDKTEAYEEALSSLKNAQKAAAAAKKDLEGVAEAITQATAAAKAVDAVIKFAVKLLV